MKKIFVLFCLSITASTFFLSPGQAVKTTKSCDDYKIYFVDRQMHRLVPTKFQPKGKSPQKIADEMISAIISGKDYNKEILRIIPNISSLIDLHIKKDTAYIDLSSELKKHIPKNPETERLFIYQLVNSISSIPEVKFIRFTIDGKTEKDFWGFLNMREIFTADYCV